MAATMNTRTLFATLTRTVLAYTACAALMLLLLWAYDHGQQRCQATQASHPAADDTRVNGAC